MSYVLLWCALPTILSAAMKRILLALLGRSRTVTGRPSRGIHPRRGRHGEQNRRIACDYGHLQPRPGPSHHGLTDPAVTPSVPVRQRIMDGVQWCGLRLMFLDNSGTDLVDLRNPRPFLKQLVVDLLRFWTGTGKQLFPGSRIGRHGFSHETSLWIVGDR